MGFVLRMAWRDTRSSRRRLVLYTASISLGIAAMVSIVSFGDSLRRAVRQQSTALLGADLVVRANEPIPDDIEAAVDALGGTRAREVGFSSMVLFPASGQSRLVSVRAIEDAFPFYGAIETRPGDAVDSFRKRRAVLVEESLMLQFGAKVGDEVRLGTQTFEIAGALLKVPGESPGFNLVAPRVYLPMAFLEQTQLVQRGSRIRYRSSLALPAGTDVENFRIAHEDDWSARGVRMETVGSREASLGRTIGNLEGFLGLVGFVALLLGAVGVASGIHVFIRQKLQSIAVLRCLGATMRQTFLIHLLQAAGMGVAGSASGAALGVVLQAIIPRVLGNLLPAEVELSVSWSAVAQGLAVGVGVTVVLALLPLLALRGVSPLLALRSTIEPSRTGGAGWRDPVRVSVIVGALAVVTGFAVQIAARPGQGVGFVAGTLGVFGVLALVGRGLMWSARRLAPASGAYVWRQGVANLFRPNNRTLLLILALGLGTFLLVTMRLTQGMLVGQLEASDAANRSNMLLFDIQTDQRDAVRAAIERDGLDVMDEAPVVSMRLASVKGRSIEELKRDPRSETPGWVLTREYRSTFRRTTNDAEEILSGKWVPEVASLDAPVPVSIEEGIARDLGVSVGDRLDFDVQGLLIECVAGSIRSVDTRRVQPFFFMVFPAGVLEDAPQFFILTTRVRDAAESARLQRALFEQFPNVSAVDLTLILETISAVTGKVAFVFRFMAVFVVATGVVVLFGVMASGRLQRLRENVLLRTLGASRRQIARIQLVEYAMLGTLAALAGVVLAWGGAWVLGRTMFETKAPPETGPLFWAWLIVSALTVAVGWLSGRRLLNHPPLELLRQET